jgi:hypothetical protein
MKKYIFILSPPYQGSTVLLNLISSSNNVSSFLKHSYFKKKSINGEGQLLMNQKFLKHRWDPEYKFSLNKLKSIYDKYWNHSKDIYVEKSPSNICRAKMIENYFKNFGEVYFIILIRNPYSTNWHSDENYDTDWVTCAKYQKYNLENLENKILIKYEDLCNNLEEIKIKIKNFLPELDKLEIIENNNSNVKLNKINKNTVNRVLGVEWKNYHLKKNKDIVNYFGYNILEDNYNVGSFWKYKDNDTVFWSNKTFDFNKDIIFNSMEQLENFKKKLEKNDSYYYHIKVIDDNKNILKTINYSEKGIYWKFISNDTIYWSNSKKNNKDIIFKNCDDHNLHRTHNGFKPKFSEIKSFN